jgi:hypothetical protein
LAFDEAVVGREQILSLRKHSLKKMTRSKWLSRVELKIPLQLREMQFLFRREVSIPQRETVWLVAIRHFLIGIPKS